MSRKLPAALRALSAALRDERINHDGTDMRRLLVDSAGLVAVLALIVEGESVSRAFGAPGDWGYGTDIGKGVFEFLSRPRDFDKTLTDSRAEQAR